MGCHYCKQYKWLDPQEVVWTDPADGKQYCVFHAPENEKHKERKGEGLYTVEEFNSLIFSRIDAVHEQMQAGGESVPCDLSGVVFPGIFPFSNYGKREHLPEIRFTGATFCGEAYFENVTFNEQAMFDEVMFCDRVWFRMTKFSDDAWFIGTTFCGAARFDLATFNVEVWFDGATFQDTVDFGGATFNGAAMFFRNIVTRSTDFSGATATKGGNVQVVEMPTASLEQLRFSRAELPLFSFRNCRWPQRLGMETYGDGGADSFLACEELYRAMKQHAAEEHDQSQVSHWHFREKLMALKRGGNGIFEAVMLWLYWATSGFGERAVRAGGLLLALAVGIFVLMGTVGMMDANLAPADVGLSERLYAGLQHLLFIANPQYTPAEPLWRSALLVLTRVLIPLQFTLFALAVRNRFRR